MYEGKNVSSLTICVLALVRLLNGWSKPLTRKLYGLQGIIPALPVPSLKDTVDQVSDVCITFTEHKILGESFR